MRPVIDPRSMRQPIKTGIVSLWMLAPNKCLALLIVFLSAICAAPVLAQEKDGKDLRAFYQKNCVECHGVDGSAVSPEGKRLSGQDFTDPDWQLNTREDKMVETILKGKFFGWAMPGFKDSLSPKEAQKMVTDIIINSKKGQVIGQDTNSSNAP
ncbi:MAG: c-type cytochrome [Desulfonatronovibrionaceae bacterium]